MSPHRPGDGPSGPDRLDTCGPRPRRLGGTRGRDAGAPGPRAGTPGRDVRRSGLLAALAVSVLALTPAGALADGPAPTTLQVDDAVAPLAVEGTPRFGWLPRASHGDAVQAAYEVEVTDADGGPVWDSGRVASAAQSQVAYAGPALRPGRTYRWRVRTWDGTGAASQASADAAPQAAPGTEPSDWSAPATFGAGLADVDWSGAQWIRRPTTGKDAENDYTLARKTFTVPGGAKVVRARAYVAAVSDWQLHVNGRTVDRSASYGFPGEGTYTATDITRELDGDQLAVGVLYHYWTATARGRAAGPVAPEGPAGTIVKVVLDRADGTTTTLVSDGTWKVQKFAAQTNETVTKRTSASGALVEYYDARLETPGWDRASFDDGAWETATVIGAHPRPNLTDQQCQAYVGKSAPCTFTHLEADTAKVVSHDIAPKMVHRLADGTIVADFGKVYAGAPSVVLRNQQAGRKIVTTASFRRTNTLLLNASKVGDREIVTRDMGGSKFRVVVGDELTIGAPAANFGPGDPETRTITGIEQVDVNDNNLGWRVTLDRPLEKPHVALNTWIEGERIGMRRLDNQGSNDMTWSWTTKAGDQTAEPFDYLGFRWIEIPDPGRDIELDDVRMRVQATDVDPTHRLAFESSSDTLDGVVDLMAHSALYGSQENFIDTPTRERGSYLGDAVAASYGSMNLLDDRRFTRENIRTFMRSQARFFAADGPMKGALNDQYPRIGGQDEIPDYTEMFPDWVRAYYERTGDEALLAEAYPVMKGVADYIQRAVDPSLGLVANLPDGNSYKYGIIDFPTVMRYGTLAFENGNYAQTVINARAVGAFDAVRQAAKVLGKTDDVATYDGYRTSVSDAMNARLRDPATGLYSDGLSTADGHPRLDSYREHAQSFPLAYGIVPAADRAKVADAVADMGMKQGPFTLRELESALRVGGREDALLKLLTDRDADGPARILDEDGTYLWELWFPGCQTKRCTGKEVQTTGDKTGAHSMSHAWGAQGVTDVLEGLVGLRVGTGAATVAIRPPARGLGHAKVTQWTVRGPVTVSWERTDDGAGIALEADVPDNVRATVSLPAVPGRTYVGDGAGAPRPTGEADGRVAFELGSGGGTLRTTAAPDGGGSTGGGNPGAGDPQPPVTVPPGPVAPTVPVPPVVPQPSAATSAPRVGSTVLRASRSRLVPVRVRCLVATGFCRGTLRLTSGDRRLGSATIRVSGKRTSTARVRLSASAYRLLVRRGTLRVSVTLAVRGPDGRTRTTARRLTLRAPARG